MPTGEGRCGTEVVGAGGSHVLDRSRAKRDGSAGRAWAIIERDSGLAVSDVENAPRRAPLVHVRHASRLPLDVQLKCN